MSKPSDYGNKKLRDMITMTRKRLIVLLTRIRRGAFEREGSKVYLQHRWPLEDSR
jgi:hypothetical protein